MSTHIPMQLIPAPEHEIRALAQKYWEDEGRPEGQAEIHWQRAYMALAKPETKKTVKASPAPRAKAEAAKPSKSKSR